MLLFLIYLVTENKVLRCFSVIKTFSLISFFFVFSRNIKAMSRDGDFTARVVDDGIDQIFKLMSES